VPRARPGPQRGLASARAGRRPLTSVTGGTDPRGGSPTAAPPRPPGDFTGAKRSGKVTTRKWWVQQEPRRGSPRHARPWVANAGANGRLSPGGKRRGTAAGRANGGPPLLGPNVPGPRGSRARQGSPQAGRVPVAGKGDAGRGKDTQGAARGSQAAAGITRPARAPGPRQGIARRRGPLRGRATPRAERGGMDPRMFPGRNRVRDGRGRRHGGDRDCSAPDARNTPPGLVDARPAPFPVQPEAAPNGPRRAQKCPRATRLFSQQAFTASWPPGPSPCKTR